MAERRYIGIISDRFDRITSGQSLGDVFSMASSDYPQHAANYLCTSQDGTVYYWSKDGKYDAPAVTTKKALASKYHSMFSLDTHRYFRFNERK